MEITINKEYTEKHEIPHVKEEIENFKICYTDGDILRAFEAALDEAGIDYPYMNSSDIVSCELKAFPGGTYYEDENGIQPTHYSVNITVDNKYIEIDKLHFYTDNALNIRLTACSFGETINMYHIERYVLQK